MTAGSVTLVLGLPIKDSMPSMLGPAGARRLGRGNVMNEALKDEHVSLQPVEEKLRATKIAKHADSHLNVRDQDVCCRCILRPCTCVCPANVYNYDKGQGLTSSYENCLECGSCMIVCEFDNLDWDYPPGGFGVSFEWG